MRLIMFLLVSFGLNAQSYDPWKDAAWYKLRGRFIYEYLEWMDKPCKDSIIDWWGRTRVFTIDKPIIDSISQGELDSICRIQNSRWVLNDQYGHIPPYNRLFMGKIRRMVIMTDCPPTTRGPFFIIETKDYRWKKRGFFKRLFKRLLKPR